jgi:hypothetical protein
VRFEHEYSGNYGAPGTATRFAVEDTQTHSAWGGRFEAGVAVADPDDFIAVAPRGALTIARLNRQKLRVDVVGVQHEWYSNAWWWSLSGGAELQMIERVICLSLEGGIASVGDWPSPLGPKGLEVEGRSSFGILGRAATSVRIPVDTGRAAGITASAEGFFFPLAPSATRVALGLFLEWDGR